jgi:phosphoserine phosphatase
VRRFASVVLDVDSTVSTIEGIDWLAALRDSETARRIEAMTLDAMESRIALDDVYAARLQLVRPTRTELSALGDAYIAAASPGVRNAVLQWQRAGVHVSLVSGGLRLAIMPLAAWLGIPSPDVHAVDVEFDALEVVSAVAQPAPLAQRGGKPRVVAALDLPRPILAVGDGATDAELVDVVDAFVAFTGVVRRDSVIARATRECASFAELSLMILDTHAD